MFHIDTTTPRWRRLATTGLALPMAVVLSGTAHAAGPSADPKAQQTSSAAQLALDVDCFSVSVSSDKDISNVKVTFADGSFQEIEGLSGHTFERTFTKEIASVTAKSATTTVEGQASDCAVAPVGEKPVVANPVVDAPAIETPVKAEPLVETPAPVCPTAPVMGPVMAGCEPVLEETPVETPTQEVPVDGTPIAGQPAPQPATGGAAAGELDTPAEDAPVEAIPAETTPATGVLGMGVAAPTAVTPVLELPAATPASAQQTPATLPFTGVDAGLLAQLGGLLLAVGGSALLLGRKPRRAKH